MNSDYAGCFNNDDFFDVHEKSKRISWDDMDDMDDLPIF